METKRLLDFLSALEANNSLEWMHANNEWYHTAREDFIKLLETLMLGLPEGPATFPPAKELISRLNRDTRFSHDKSPYSPAFRAHLSPGGRAPIPVGYFLHVQPGRIFLAGGLFAPMFPQATTLVRDAIVKDGQAFADSLAPALSAGFVLTGEKLKRVPRGYDADHPMAEYLKHKAWAFEYPVDDALFADGPSFVQLASELFPLLRAPNEFLNRALESFQFPAR